MSTEIKVNEDNSREVADFIIKTLDAKKAKDIKLIRIEDKTVLADYFVICGGNSNTQVRALAGEVEEKLEENGYIKGYHAHLSPQAFGLNIKAFINLELEPIRKQEFYPYIRSCKNVAECSCVTGDYSMLLKVFFSSTDELDAFINEIQHFGKTKTQIVFSTPVEPRDTFIL